MNEKEQRKVANKIYDIARQAGYNNRIIEFTNLLNSEIKKARAEALPVLTCSLSVFLTTLNFLQVS